MVPQDLHCEMRKKRFLRRPPFVGLHAKAVVCAWEKTGFFAFRNSGLQKGFVSLTLLLASLASLASYFFPIAPSHTTTDQVQNRTPQQTETTSILKSKPNIFTPVLWYIRGSEQVPGNFGFSSYSDEPDNFSIKSLLAKFFAPLAGPFVANQPKQKQSKLPVSQFWQSHSFLSLGGTEGVGDNSSTVFSNQFLTHYFPTYEGDIIEGGVQIHGDNPDGATGVGWNGRTIPFTAQDYWDSMQVGVPRDQIPPVTAASDASRLGELNNIPSYTFTAYDTNGNLQSHTIENLPVYNEDTGPAVHGNHLDIATQTAHKDQLTALNNANGNTHQDLTPLNDKASREAATGNFNYADRTSNTGTNFSSTAEGNGLLAGDSSAYPSGVGAWIDRTPGENVCYKHMGGPGGSNEYRGVLSCNKGFKWTYESDGHQHPEEVKDCGKRATNSGGKTQNGCEESATTAGGGKIEGDGAYACLWLACKKGNNAIWDQQTKKCGCDDGGGNFSSGLANGVGEYGNPGLNSRTGAPLPPASGNGHISFDQTRDAQAFAQGSFGDGVPINTNVHNLVSDAANQFDNLHVSSMIRYGGTTTNGTSQHNTGDAVDMYIAQPDGSVDIARTSQLSQWVFENAPKYQVYQEFFTPVNGIYTLNLKYTNGQYTPYSINNTRDLEGHRTHLHVGVQ